ncbi:protoporphyrinogen oxidase [soil metagenome]
MIAIVGGGLTGLALGHHLKARGVAHTILEAAERPGGVIRSRRVQGHLLEWGPQRARLTRGFQQLVDDLGLNDQLLLAPRDLPLFVYSRGKLRQVPFSPAQFLRSSIFSWPGKFRLLLEPFTGAAKQGETVADYFTRKVGREAYEKLLGPLYGGLYASDPADMIVGLSLGHVLREFGIQRSLILPLLRRGGSITPPPACSFREGLQTLPNALHENNRENVRLASAVRAIRRHAGGYRLSLDSDHLDAHQVVLTVPARQAAQLLEEVAPQPAASVAQLHYNPLGVVHLHAQTGPTGLGYQVAFTEKLFTRGVTFNHSLFGRRGIYTAYLGGAKAPHVVDLPDLELGEIAELEFRRVTGHSAQSISVDRERMPAWDVSWQALGGMQLPIGIHIAANWESRPGMPGRLAQATRLADLLTTQANQA